MLYQLHIETDTDPQQIRFRLCDADGIQLAAQQTPLPQENPALWEGLFDTRRYVERYQGSVIWEDQTEPATAEQVLAQLGTFLGAEVLGHAILAALTQTTQRRTLLVRLPPTAGNVLAAAMARVPWEIARPAPEQPALMDTNLIVRMVTADTAEADATVAAEAAKVQAGQESLRVLIAFAEAPGSRPLAMRFEREQLLELFRDAILPKRRVQVDVLCHGVTRAVLCEQIRAAGGYHIVHWSGHGHLNLLELCGEDGSQDLITGEDLVALFADAGGFIPQMVFLSACLSGAFVEIRDWATLQAALRGERPDKKSTDPRLLRDVLDNATGYTGTALALLRSGVQQVIAMRYEVGDDYARELARSFYRHLLVDSGRHPTDSALALARGDLLQDAKQAAQSDAVDHATSLIFGQPGRLLEPASKRSEQLRTWRPRPQPLVKELDRPAHFVGRGEPLTQLNVHWLNDSGPAVALVQGLGGLGKTAIAAESVHLWHRRFDWVLAFQAKPTPLTIEAFYQQVDGKLTLDSAAYRDKCEDLPNDRVYLPPGQPLSGDARYERLRVNLLEALRDEAILLVLDNFETNLETQPRADGYACADPQWDRLLEYLIQELPGTRSRLLLTSRHRPAVLAADGVLTMPLGPLPMAEANLFVRTHEDLRKLLFGDDAGRMLIAKLLHISRGHPLILDRLGRLADDRAALSAALDRVQGEGWQSLPDVFAPTASAAAREQERRYLEDVAVGSVDFLIERLSLGARRVLWLVTLAFEPVPEDFFDPALKPLLDELHDTGLLTRETQNESIFYAFHELVRERIAAWMDRHEADRLDRTAEEIWINYGGNYAAMYKQIKTSSREYAWKAAFEAGRRALVYLIRARAFERLGSLASNLTIEMNNPLLLRSVVAELQILAEQAPVGETRWCVRASLANALAKSGQPDQSLDLYEQAAAEAEAANHWTDAAWICANWANALGDVGQLDTSKAMHQRSADAYRKACKPEIHVIGRELEALRIDVIQGAAEKALPDIMTRLDKVRGWYRKQRAGKSVQEAPNPETLVRALLGGLDTARQANSSLERWQNCLALLDEMEQVKRELGKSQHDLAITRFNQHSPLIKLGQLDDAQHVLEKCLDIFRKADDMPRESSTLSALADVWNKKGNQTQAIALERQALAAHNRFPDPEKRATSHNNLSNHLNRTDQPEESTRHLLAAIVYFIVTGHHEKLQILLRNLGNRVQRSAQAGERYELPRLEALLARPEFDALRQFLEQWKVDVQELQAVIDKVVEQIRQQINEPRP